MEDNARSEHTLDGTNRAHRGGQGLDRVLRWGIRIRIGSLWRGFLACALLGWPIWAYTRVIYIHRFLPACGLGTFFCLGSTQGQQTICYCCRLPTSQKPPGLSCLLQKQYLLSDNAIRLSRTSANACWGLAAAAGDSSGHQTVAQCSTATASSAHIVRITLYS